MPRLAVQVRWKHSTIVKFMPFSVTKAMDKAVKKVNEMSKQKQEVKTENKKDEL